MVQLFLSEATGNDVGGEGAVEAHVSLLKELQTTIWSLLMSCGGRSEARLWLCDDLSHISAIPSHRQHEPFVKILRSKPTKQVLAAQVFRMIFEKWPRKPGHVLAKRSDLLEDFFRDNPRRILHWFSSFAGIGHLGHKKGAKALSQFAFVNRDICWEELEWKGKHGQSPAMVATKPHYFLDLDVQRTVENFLENVPEFWASNEFADSLESGEILFVDKQYFLDLFVDLMFKEDSKEVWEFVTEFLKEEPFDMLCRHLLIILEEQELSMFLELLGELLSPRTELTEFDKSSFWLEIVLSRSTDSVSMEQLLFLNSVISQGRKLLRLVYEEDYKEQKGKIENIVARIIRCPTHPCNLAHTMKRSLKSTTVELMNWLGVQSWAFQFRLAEECRSPGKWESLFLENGISFRRAKKYELLHHDSLPEKGNSYLDERSSAKVRKKKEKHRKRRRKNLVDDDVCDDDLDLGMLGNDLSLKLEAGSWLLSTDGYTLSWASVDLPEHLSKHCFSTWMKWISLN